MHEAIAPSHVEADIRRTELFPNVSIWQFKEIEGTAFCALIYIIANYIASDYFCSFVK